MFTWIVEYSVDASQLGSQQGAGGKWQWAEDGYVGLYFDRDLQSAMCRCIDIAHLKWGRAACLEHHSGEER